MDDLSRRAVAAALAVSRNLGLRCGDEPELLADGANVLARLVPAPVVARVATTTALVRRPAEQWLQRDVDMARYLAAQGCPVVPPSGELDPGPHHRDGFAISFWQYVEHDRNYAVSANETASFLRELHTALRGYRGKLEYLSPFSELPGWISDAETMGTLSANDAPMLLRAHMEIAEQIRKLNLPEQPIHGDAHRKNLLKTGKGLLWTDFEDSCRGPLEWDIACVANAAKEGPQAALAAFGADLEQIEPFLAARDLQGAVWLPIMATRFADRRARAAEWLAGWRSRMGRM
jgi:Phosphotransferase enzyme family